MAKPAKNQCVGCACALGADPKIAPVRVTAENGKDPELWCPRCFVHKRAPMEPGRWQGLEAVLCGQCGHETLAVNAPRCGECGSRVLIICPAQRAVA